MRILVCLFVYIEVFFSHVGKALLFPWNQQVLVTFNRSCSRTQHGIHTEFEPRTSRFGIHLESDALSLGHSVSSKCEFVECAETAHANRRRCFSLICPQSKQ